MPQEASNPQTAGNDGTAANQPQVLMQRIYCRDASLEVPFAPQIFNQKEWAPKVDVQVGTEVTSLGNDFHQVSLNLTVTAKTGDDDKVAYLVEIKQAGLFLLTGFSDPQQLQAVLGAFCPNTIFPFARETVSDLVQRAGFPQLLLQPINFEALYAQHLSEIQGQQAANGAAPTPATLN
ncbi:MAG TPA: protein-export chaperone SecB [Nevskiaceae bacterium]|nr:protein-export chaperone SecB [Nevskiaceae bacterium]